MKTTELAALTDFSPAVEGEERVVTGVYCADLLSWAMAKAPAGAAWCTVMRA